VSATLSDAIPIEKNNTKIRNLVSDAVKLMENGDLPLASQKINQALKLDISNPYIQFLNGLIYSHQAKSNDKEKAKLAAQGFELSRQFDPSNWITAYHQGLLNLNRRQFSLAQKYFAEAALLNDNYPNTFYHLAAASYHAHDPVTAAGALNKLRAFGNHDKDPHVLRASALVMASLNNVDEAAAFNKQYKNLISQPDKQKQLDGRLKDWSNFHNLETINPPSIIQTTTTAEKIQLAQLNMNDSSEKKQTPLSFSEDKPKNKNEMVIVDVVIIRTEENSTTRKGVNLLNSLSIQFGQSENPGLKYARIRDLPSSNNVLRTVVRNIEIPSITYSLNIANSNTNRSEILARPSLTALNGKVSKFFSGININGAATSDTGGGTPVGVQKDIGVSMAILPKLLKNGRLILKVVAERTFLSVPNNTSITFAQRIDTSKTKVSATVNMKFGETIILSGLSEKETEYSRDGVPGLQEIPVLQYGFSREDNRNFQKSVLILLTPRRAAYTHQTAIPKVNSKSSLSNRNILNDLRSRYSDWFYPYPNWASVFNHMQKNSLYREFRTGDVELENWENDRVRSNRIKRILDFIYF
jgi:general secretion pathway protein D